MKIFQLFSKRYKIANEVLSAAVSVSGYLGGKGYPDNIFQFVSAVVCFPYQTWAYSPKKKYVNNIFFRAECSTLAFYLSLKAAGSKISSDNVTTATEAFVDSLNAIYPIDTRYNMIVQRMEQYKELDAENTQKLSRKLLETVSNAIAYSMSIKNWAIEINCKYVAKKKDIKYISQLLDLCCESTSNFACNL